MNGLRDDDGWDGKERRSLNPTSIAEQLVPIMGQTRPAPSISTTTMIVIAAAVVLLQATALIQHAILGGHLGDEEAKQQQFRQTVSCFLFEITRPVGAEPVDRADVLVRCGLVGAQRPQEVE